MSAPASQSALFNEHQEENQRSKADVILEFALQSVFSTEDIDLKTDIDRMQVLHLSRAEVFCQRFPGTTVMRTFTTSLKRLSVSKNRKGREEAVSIIKSAHEEPVETGGFDNIRAKLFGK